MKKLMLVLIILLLMSGVVNAEWTDFQKSLSFTYASLVATDLTQSQHWIEYTADNPRIIGNGYVYEANPFVAGKTIGQVTFMAIGANFLLYKFADNLKSDHRTMLLIAATLIEGKVVYDNHKTMESFNLEYKLNFLQFNF